MKHRIVAAIAALGLAIPSAAFAGVLTVTATGVASAPSETAITNPDHIREELRAQAIGQAIASARAQAQQIASSSGSSLGSMLNLTISTPSPVRQLALTNAKPRGSNDEDDYDGPSPRPAVAFANVMDATSQITVRVQVTLTFDFG